MASRGFASSTQLYMLTFSAQTAFCKTCHVSWQSCMTFGYTCSTNDRYKEPRSALWRLPLLEIRDSGMLPLLATCTVPGPCFLLPFSACFFHFSSVSLSALRALKVDVCHGPYFCFGVILCNIVHIQGISGALLRIISTSLIPSLTPVSMLWA